MTTERRAETVLPRILQDLAHGPYPEYVVDVLAITSRTRQRPAWASVTRWLPIGEVVRARSGAGRMAWRAIALAAVVMALVLAGLLALGGSARRLPPPFGPAANGLVAFEDAGDIHVIDLAAGISRPVIGGSHVDVGPRFSPDGWLIAFERREADVSRILAARSDGTGARRLTTEPVELAPSDIGRAWERYEFSPDSATLLINTLDDDGRPNLTLAATDGSGTRILDVGMAASEASFRPPDGREILFIGRRDDVGLYAVDVVTGLVRSILVLPSGFDVAGASWSPDGSRIAYWSWGGPAEGLNSQSRIVQADGTGDRALPLPEDAVWSAHATWSNDGTRIFIARGQTPGFDDVRGVVLAADGSDVGVEVAPSGLVETSCCAAWAWSPDDRFLLGRSASGTSSGRLVLIDVAARTARRVPFNVTGDASWQRRLQELPP